MKTINPLIDLDHFFTQVGATQRRALLLDYEGHSRPFVSSATRPTHILASAPHSPPSFRLATRA